MVRFFRSFLLILLIYSVFIAFLGIAFDTYYTIKYGGIDLRNRVVGARNLLTGNDPYYTKWDAETEEYYVDGRDYYAGLSVSRCTVSPSFLLLHAPFAKISYKTQQYLWFALQELLLIGSILILAKAAGKRYKIVLIIGFMFFMGSYFWRFHVANGQIYILFSAAIIAAYKIAKYTNKEFWAGFILGWTATWRPPLLLLGLPFLICRKWKLIFGGIAGILMGFLSSFLIADISNWRNYFSAMKVHGAFHSGLLQPELMIHPNSNNIEGIRNSFFSADVPGLDSSIQGIFQIHFDQPVNAGFLWLGLAAVILLLCISLWKYRNYAISTELLFYQGTVLVLISEYFLPAARLSYNNVIWLVPLTLLLITLRDWKKLLNFPLIFLLTGLADNYLYNLYPRSILFADYSILIYLIWMWFVMMKGLQEENSKILFP